MNGIGAVINSNFWGVSNEVSLDTYKYLEEINGQNYSKRVLTLKIMHIFTNNMPVNVGDEVECIFKTDDNKTYSFIGNIKSTGKVNTIIDNLKKTERYKDTLNKLKKWQTLHHYLAI